MAKEISPKPQQSLEHLVKENETLRTQLAEAEETLRAIRSGEVDALLVSGPEGAQVFTLVSAEQPYRDLIEQMQEGAVTLSRGGTVLYCNLRFAQMLNIPHERILASEVQNLVVPHDLNRFRELLQIGIARTARAEITLANGDGQQLPTYITVGPISGEAEGSICMVVTNLTEQESMRRNHAVIEALNARLRRAMTETHHRVKNSLQIMSALVDLHVIENSETVPTSAIRNLNMQIRALATVHDVLTRQSVENSETESVSSALLLSKLLSTLQTIAAPRALVYDVDNVLLFGRQPIALALIVNELVLNALKHSDGSVSVTFCCHGPELELHVVNDGACFADGFNPESAAGTGLTLVSNLVSWDLEGRVTYTNRSDGEGVRVTVTFPIAASQPPADFAG